jgi:cellulose synthase/poly-beta-1,6-N-acetylglucosamine synthase-like glycosyltransferase
MTSEATNAPRAVEVSREVYGDHRRCVVLREAVAEKLGMGRERSFYNQRNRGILTHLYAFDSEPTEANPDF